MKESSGFFADETDQDRDVYLRRIRNRLKSLTPIKNSSIRYVSPIKHRQRRNRDLNGKYKTSITSREEVMGSPLRKVDSSNYNNTSFVQRVLQQYCVPAPLETTGRDANVEIKEALVKRNKDRASINMSNPFVKQIGTSFLDDFGKYKMSPERPPERSVALNQLFIRRHKSPLGDVAKSVIASGQFKKY